MARCLLSCPRIAVLDASFPPPFLPSPQRHTSPAHGDVYRSGDYTAHGSPAPAPADIMVQVFKGFSTRMGACVGVHSFCCLFLQVLGLAIVLSSSVKLDMHRLGSTSAHIQSMLSQQALLTPLKVRESHYTRLLSEHAAQVCSLFLVASCSHLPAILIVLCAGTHRRGGSHGLP